MRAGYSVGDSLRVPLNDARTGDPRAADLVIVGTVRISPVEGALLQGTASTLEGVLFTGEET